VKLKRKHLTIVCKQTTTAAAQLPTFSYNFNTWANTGRSFEDKAMTAAVTGAAKPPQHTVTEGL
jgi:hypothetical protein